MHESYEFVDILLARDLLHLNHGSWFIGVDSSSTKRALSIIVILSLGLGDYSIQLHIENIQLTQNKIDL